ncbi:hypothetical protein BCIN_06g04550 [Botrytis cinerea B05.10]|uniref:Zn(2)-C6 fungal-type domain-containing protein n=3 Tax=Botryotinia fuckeliana TaxID=40559 RepID=A0A384JK74_BOTFB|nr:hypothetical protein BCIN_06g04550 [Botrytis cinerea B05.10]ATZ50999.1 hypothetical protein BCIN_06g04550 [Botrytis cinerea B05.10]EMR86448.1 putative c6 finger domain-containing protein [Botrytis cinerea BcDW1]CCD56803.1 similar to transcription factor Cys6 [Botrytis cinerea T4]
MATPLPRGLRAHTKSRQGCMACKSRKVKCNEVRPACDACLRREISCHYALPAQKRLTETRSPFNPPYDLDPSRELDITVTRETKERRLLEMRLLHHFCSETAQKGFLSIHDEAVRDLWTKGAPTLAFDHPVLLNIMISIAALHLTKINPADEDMADVHRIYFNAAVREHCQIIQNINKDNVEAVCLSTILIGLPAFILLQNNNVGHYTVPTQVFALLRGNVALFSLTIPMLDVNSQLEALMSAKPDMKTLMADIRGKIYHEPFSELLNWRAPGEIIDEESQAAYTFALNYCGRILLGVEGGEDLYELRRVIYAFPTVTHEAFVQQLNKKNNRALVILAHFFALCKAADNVWWMRGISEREVFGIQSILPENWQWAMAWPLQKLAEYAAINRPASTK